MRNRLGGHQSHRIAKRGHMLVSRVKSQTYPYLRPLHRLLSPQPRLHLHINPISVNPFSTQGKPPA